MNALFQDFGFLELILVLQVLLIAKLKNGIILFIYSRIITFLIIYDFHSHKVKISTDCQWLNKKIAKHFPNAFVRKKMFSRCRKDLVILIIVFKLLLFGQLVVAC